VPRAFQQFVNCNLTGVYGRYAAMIATTAIEELERIDAAILRMILERRRHCLGLTAEEREALDEREIVAFWLEEGGDAGLEDGPLESVAKGVLKLCTQKED